MLADLFAPIDIYCERVGPGLLAEPLNAVTNLSFLFAGIWGLAAMRRANAGSFATLLAWMVIIIGFGSAAFHTFANGLTMLADVVPIGLFTLLYTVFVLRALMALSWPASLAIFIVFYAAAFGLATLVPDWLAQASNGSTGYLVPFLSLLVFGTLLTATANPAGRTVLAATAVFLVSVAFRSVDHTLCASWPIGSHFMWHVLNGLVLGLLLAAAARRGHAPKEKGPARGRAL